ncbi:MAG: radical SAM protein [Intestinimonas sp.]|jgi:MoaA/NifB/PqqE/SkfB family radical SAM enzyme|nr:radical SAM protein [Intestinimonas sp.]
MGDRTIGEQVQTFALKKVLNYLNEDPDVAFPKILEWVDRFDTSGTVASQRKVFHNILDHPDCNWYRLAKTIWNCIDPQVRATFFENFILNASTIGMQRQHKAKDKYGCNVPWAILMDPTSACNLHCTGCWAAEYGNKLNMDYNTLDNIIRQGTETGTFMYIYSGGEPLVRKNDIIKLCQAHPDCMFLAFTNATLIDEAFADEMLRVKNFIPAISIEGFEAETDFRRGKGTYAAVARAMSILKAKHLPFGASCCYTSKNVDTIGSEEYFDDLIEKGCLFAWFFTYMPVGHGAPTDLMATADQRKFMYDQVRKFRKTKPLFTMDFWNDGEYVNGCIAGGRNYLHINANGDIEPCAFIHYSDSNIHTHTLLQAYQNPLFMQYHDHQPFSPNHLRPCPLLDNHGALAEMIHHSGAQSTDMLVAEDVDELCGKCKYAADHWQPVADRLWTDSGHTLPCASVCEK